MECYSEHILECLEARGVLFCLKGDNVFFRAPKGVVTDEIRETLKLYKRELVDTLKYRESVEKVQ